MATDFTNFAFSFQHAIIKVGDRQFTSISGVSFSQAIERSGIFGAGAVPLKRTEGRADLGDGTLTFSDAEEAFQFYASLGENAARSIFDVDITLSNPSGDTRQVQLVSCALTEFSADWESGPDALGLEFPFDFMRIKIDGVFFVK